jgi:hypothetical protein
MKLPILSFHFGVTCFARGGKTKKREAKEKVSLVDKCQGVVHKYTLIMGIYEHCHSML